MLKRKNLLADAAPVKLPTKRSPVCHNLGDFAILLYGEKKIGKTSVAAQFPNAILFEWELGGRSLEAFQVPDRNATPPEPVLNWKRFVRYIDLLEKDTTYKTVVIDPVDLAYKSCSKHVCRQLGIDHPSDEKWGKGWDAVDTEFVAQFERLAATQKGIVYITHAEKDELTGPDGITTHRIETTLPTQAKRYFERIVDIWAYIGYSGKRREMIIRGNAKVLAGCRLRKHFLCDKKPVRAIPLGRNPEEAYANFLSCFQNKLSIKEEL